MMLCIWSVGGLIKQKEKAMNKLMYVGILSGLMALQSNASAMTLKKIEVDGLQRVEKSTVLSQNSL